MKAVEAYYQIKDQKERDEHVERYGISLDSYESVNEVKVQGVKIVAQVQN